MADPYDFDPYDFDNDQDAILLEVRRLKGPDRWRLGEGGGRLTLWRVGLYCSDPSGRGLTRAPR